MGNYEVSQWNRCWLLIIGSSIINYELLLIHLHLNALKGETYL